MSRRRAWSEAAAAKREAVEAYSEPDDGQDERDRACTACGGSGADTWESFMPCETCDGEGVQWWL